MNHSIGRTSCYSRLEILTIVFVLSSSLACGAASYHKFDSEKWKQVELYGDDDTRLSMYGDLISRHKLIGKSKEEIIDLLGGQSDPAYFKDMDLRYWLGPEGGITGIDSNWLVLKLDNNRIVHYEMVTD
jgi:hypothetical protein